MATCVQCGDAFAAQRSTARYCSPRCKKQYARTTAAPLTAVADPAGSSGSVGGDPAGTVEEATRIFAATLAELEELGKVETVLGQQALEMARRMTQARDTGSSAAAVSRELDRLMLRVRGSAASGEDQLARARRRRDEKRHRATQREASRLNGTDEEDR